MAGTESITQGGSGFGVLVAINMAWPRTPDAAWYDNYLVLLSAVLVVVGLVYHPTLVGWG